MLVARELTVLVLTVLELTVLVCQEATPRACLCWEAPPALNLGAMKPRSTPASSLSSLRYCVSEQHEYTAYSVSVASLSLSSPLSLPLSLSLSQLGVVVQRNALADGEEPHDVVSRDCAVGVWSAPLLAMRIILIPC